jgi:methyl-accepting chemotaxis protein
MVAWSISMHPSNSCSKEIEMTALSIRHRLIGFAAVGAAVSCVVAGTAFTGMHQAKLSTNTLEDSAFAVRSAMKADMKHDNIRSEIMKAANAARASNAAELNEVQKDVPENVKELMESLAIAAEKAPTPESKEAVKLALPVAQSYADAATKALADIKANPVTADAAVVEFDKAFHALEVVLEKSGDVIEKSAVQAADDAHRASDKTVLWLAVATGLGLTSLLIFSFFTIRSIMTPLRALRGAVQDLNEDDGDLSRRLPLASASEFNEVSSLFNSFLEKIGKVVGDVQHAATEISSASSQMAAGNQELSKRTEQSSSSLQQAAASVEQITVTMRHSADSARQANELASSASAVAEKGGDAVSRVVTTMEEINVASRKISDIIGVIDGIAFQTNILALNAAVEAARAGEQGRGFAVVAAEVRSLAQRSAEAAREIKGLIGTSVQKVEAGGQYVKDAGNTMGEIVTSVKRVSAMIHEITSAATEQSAGISLVNETVNGLDRSTQQNSALVEQTAAAAGQMAQQAKALAQTVSVFRTAA